MRVRILGLLILLAVSESLFAAGPVQIGANGYGPLAADAHLGWARVSVYWFEIETADGVFDFSAADYVVNQARSNNQKVLFMLSGPPSFPPHNGGVKHNTPPALSLWQRYVDQVSRHFTVADVAAYEIWNEPNAQNSSTTGVGWDRDVNLAPLYVDYLVEASKLIRANSPGTLVVGPALSGTSNSRTETIFQHLETRQYSGVFAHTFVDVISMHANAGSTENGDERAEELANGTLADLTAFSPSSSGKDIWITEFGWDSNIVGTGNQRQYIHDFLREVAGERNGYLATFKITHAMIYSLNNCDAGRPIYTFTTPPVPKSVVPQYLQLLPAPATQYPDVVVTGVTPSSGTTAGGTAVTVNGSSFSPGATVSIGGVAATGVT